MRQPADHRGLATSRGGTSLIVVVLLAGILLALVVLIALLATASDGRASGEKSTGDSAPLAPAVADGQEGRVNQFSSRRSPAPLDDPDRIQETLRPGKTYSVVIKAGIDARAEDKAWWRKEIVHLAYVAEMQIDRTIESNDGRRVVELRHFVASRNAKLLCDVEDASIDLGAPGTLVLGALSSLKPEAGIALTLAKPVADAILRSGAQQATRSAATKAFAHVDTLSGKTIRIVYLDGVGVESIVPVGCTLNAEERDFVSGTAILSDCYIWDLKKAPGERWKVDGAQLSGLVDPSLRGSTEGTIGFVRDADGREGGLPYATLRIEGGTLTIDASDASRRRIGRFTPEGTLRFSRVDKVVEQASLTDRFAVDEVSTDHILFETRAASPSWPRIESRSVESGKASRLAAELDEVGSAVELEASRRDPEPAFGTDPLAFLEPRPVSPKDILATAYHLLGIDPALILADRLGRPLPAAGDGVVIPEWLA
jgi:hypothetical protein